MSRNELNESWISAIGEKYRGVSEATEIRDGILLVDVIDSPTLQDIIFQKEKARRLLSPAGVKDIRFRVCTSRTPEASVKTLTYSEKLRDPRWQKIRLQVFERDGWACQACYDSETTLNVHHRYYSRGAEPWDYPLEALVTLCETCHKAESEDMPRILGRLNEELKQKFLSGDVMAITIGFRSIEIFHSAEVTASALCWALADRAMMDHVGEAYFADCKKRMDEARQKEGQ